jgi:hypothetical protein
MYQIDMLLSFKISPGEATVGAQVGSSSLFTRMKWELELDTKLQIKWDIKYLECLNDVWHMEYMTSNVWLYGDSSIFHLLANYHHNDFC